MHTAAFVPIDARANGKPSIPAPRIVFDKLETEERTLAGFFDFTSTKNEYQDTNYNNHNYNNKY